MLKSLKWAFAAVSLVAVPAAAMQSIIVHRDPGCGCCEEWAAQVRAAFGQPMRMIDTPRRGALQAQYGIPATLGSCHTAIIGGIAFEGHVPIADMRRALAARSGRVRALAVPGMPIGSLGMEAGGRQQRYIVYSIGRGTPQVFARH